MDILIPWNSLEIHGIQGSSFHGILKTFSKEFHGKWIFMEIDGDISMEFHGSAWRDFRGISWSVSIEFHGNCVLILHGIPWRIFHGIPWRFFTRERPVFLACAKKPKWAWLFCAPQNWSPVGHCITTTRKSWNITSQAIWAKLHDVSKGFCYEFFNPGQSSRIQLIQPKVDNIIVRNNICC